MITLRPEQERIIQYSQGKMGISAVPGSGKTWTLSYLAADLIRRGLIDDDQEILIVTLVNSAVDNFYQRISGFIKEFGMIPGLGYRVRTLHALAHDIVRERPALLGLDNNFVIIDEREANAILFEICKTWLQTHSKEFNRYLNAEIDESKIEWIRRDHLPALIQSTASSFIRIAKDLQLTSMQVRQLASSIQVPLELVDMGCAIYENYQASLSYRAAVDFDDLIRLALQALESDTSYLERLHLRWPYILEDEAQDSSRLQEKILRKLTAPDGNWVRVGDPNQAIYETFTTAKPQYLIDFLKESGVISQHLPVSGRSTHSIIQLANYLVRWTQSDHPNKDARSALIGPPYIQPTSPDDPQANPDDGGSYIRLIQNKYSPDDEIRAIVRSVEKWLARHPDQTVAVLAPRNQRAFELINALARQKIPYNDSLLRSTSSTRFSAGALGNLLRYLSAPHSASKLATAYRVWKRSDHEESNPDLTADLANEWINRLAHVEDYLWPGPQGDFLEESGVLESNPDVYAQLSEFCSLVQRWHQSVTLPIDQLILTLAQDLFTSPPELAVAHKLAGLLRQFSIHNPGLHLPDFASELREIAINERRFLGFSEDDSGFDPDTHPGVVVVATMHKAKGLEWDRVYIMSVSNYDFPSGQLYDTYISEKYYIRDSLNLEAEAISQLRTLLTSEEDEWYIEGQASQQARIDYIQERLRLLYVGITRAKKELIMTWNSGKSSKLVIEPAIPFLALNNYLDSV